MAENESRRISDRETQRSRKNTTSRGAAPGQVEEMAAGLPTNLNGGVLGDERLGHPTAATHRAEILNRLQRSLGNAHVQRVVEQFHLQRRSAEDMPKVMPSPFEEEGRRGGEGGETGGRMPLLMPNPFEGGGGETFSGPGGLVTALGEEMEMGPAAGESAGPGGGEIGAPAAGAAPAGGGLRPSPFEEGGGVAPVGTTTRERLNADVLGRMRIAHTALSGQPPDAQLAYTSLSEAESAANALERQSQDNPRLDVEMTYLASTLIGSGRIALGPHIGRTTPIEEIRDCIDPEGRVVRPVIDRIEGQL